MKRLISLSVVVLLGLAFVIPISSSWSAGTLKVTTPNGGQKWETGKKYAIKWVKGNAGGTVKIQLLKSGKHHKWIAKKTKNDGKYTWKIPTTVDSGSAYKVKIVSVKNKRVFDKSNKNFTITQTDSGGSTKSKGVESTSSNQTSHNSKPTNSSVLVAAFAKSSSAVTSWPCVFTSDKGRRVYYKLDHHKSIAKGPGGACRVSGRSTETKAKIDALNCCNKHYSNCSTYDVNGDVCETNGFSISAPNGGEKWKTGKKYAIKWVKGNGGTFVRIQLLKSDKHYKWVSKKTKNDGKHPWKVPATVASGSAYKIKITSVKNKKVFDKSNKNFTISKTGGGSDDDNTSTLKVTTPNGGETWKPGTKYVIKWDKGNGGKFVRIFLQKSGSRYQTISRKTGNDGKHPWKVPATITTGSAYKIRVQAVTDTTVRDDSNNNFTIGESFPSGDYAYLNKHNAYQLSGYTTRWKSKTIQVSGATGSWRSAVNRWPTVSFRHVGSAPALGDGIQIVGYADIAACGVANWTYWSNGKMASCKIRVASDHSLKGCGSEADTMTHEIGHCIGFFNHTADGGLMDATAAGSSEITPPVRNMISLLYSLSPGTNINSKLRSPSAKRRPKSNKYDPAGTRLYSGSSYFMKNGEVKIVPDW